MYLHICKLDPVFFLTYGKHILKSIKETGVSLQQKKIKETGVAMFQLDYVDCGHQRQVSN